MSSGRRDYNLGLVDEKSSQGRDCASIFDFQYYNIAPGNTHNMITYTVPAGYILKVYKVLVSCEQRENNYFAVRKGLSTVIATYFSDCYDLSFSDANPLQIPEGYSFIVLCTNQGAVTAKFNVSYIATLENIS